MMFKSLTKLKHVYPAELKLLKIIEIHSAYLPCKGKEWMVNSKLCNFYFILVYIMITSLLAKGFWYALLKLRGADKIVNPCLATML